VRKVILSFYFCILIIPTLYAQDRVRIDSLLNLLPSKADTQLVIVYKELAREYRNVSIDTALSYTEMGLKLANEQRYARGKADLLATKGVILTNKGAYRDALKCYYQSNEINQNLKDQVEIAENQNDIGNIYNYMGDYRRAIQSFEKALDIYRMLAHQVGIAQTMAQIGGTYLDQGEYYKATKVLLRSIKISDEFSDTKTASVALSNLATVYYRQGKYDEAGDMYRQLLKINRKAGNKRNIGICLNNVGNYYFSINDYSEALKYYTESVQIARKLKYNSGLSSRLNNVAAIYYKQKDYYKAIELFKDVVSLCDSLNDHNGKSRALNNIATCYLAFQNYKNTILYAMQSLKIAQLSNKKETIKNASIALAQAYEHLHEAENSLKYYKLYYIYKDSLSGTQVSNQISELSIKYETEKKERENLVLVEENMSKELEIAQKKDLILTLSLCFALVLIVTILFLFYTRYQSKMNRIELEQKMLRLRMNPHFIFNAMNSIQNCILNKDKMVAFNYHGKFAKLMRMMLMHSREKTTLIKDEVSFLGLYMDLEALRTDNKFSYTIELSKSIIPEKHRIPTMIIQPFIENAIWHGIMNKEGQGEITVALNLSDSVLKCTVEDNGVGRAKTAIPQKEQGDRHEPVAVSVTKERLNLYNQLYKNQLNVIITDLKNESGEPTGTRVETFIAKEIILSENND